MIKLIMDKKKALALVKKDCRKFDTLPDNLKNDKDIILQIVEEYPGCFYYVKDKKILSDKNFILECLDKASGDILEHLDKKLKADEEIVVKALKKFGNSLEHVDKKFKKDKKIVLLALENAHPFGMENYIDKSLLKDKDIKKFLDQ